MAKTHGNYNTSCANFIQDMIWSCLNLKEGHFRILEDFPAHNSTKMRVSVALVAHECSATVAAVPLGHRPSLFC